ncbi:MAG: nuclear transport factor 2 family protein [Dehalococcoidia bacterium]
MAVQGSSDSVFDAFIRSFERDSEESPVGLLAPDLIVTDWMLPGVTLRGRDEVLAKFFAPLPASFPDVFFELEEAVFAGTSEDGYVTARGDFTGTFVNDYRIDTVPSPITIRAHGRPVRWTAHDIYRFKDGKIVEIWFGNDTLTVASQLGCIAEEDRPW